MTPIDLLIQIRRGIIEVLGGVRDSDRYWPLDASMPNSVTKIRLSELLTDSISKAQQCGIFMVTRICSCPSPSHVGSYLSPVIDGIEIYGCKRNTWPGHQFFQGKRVLSCPCSGGDKKVMAHVIDELVIRGVTKKQRHLAIVEALSDLQEAIDSAEDKRPRSAIREHLLRALITINDSIVHPSVEEVIAARGASSIAKRA